MLVRRNVKEIQLTTSQIGTHPIEKTLSCKQHIYYEWYDRMVFWEAGKLASFLGHRWDNINTGYPNLIQNRLSNENILDINIWNWVARLSVLSSQNSIVSHLLWFRLCTRQRFINQVYTNARTNVEKITIIFLKCSNVQSNVDSQEEKTNTDEHTIARKMARRLIP